MNQSVISVTTFIMVGLRVSHALKVALFVVFLVAYVVTISGNLLIIILSSLCTQLWKPMYFFLSNLSVCDILLTTNIAPNMLHLLLIDQGIISVAKCFLQFYMFGTSATTECFLLAVMSYDRYLAICNPLRYSSIMDERRCFLLTFIVWFTGLLATAGTIVLMARLRFCKANVIDHFFCDREPILSLSCSDTTEVRLEALVFSFCITLWPFLVIVLSYVAIIHTILGMTTSKERQKTFSTCSSHLTVVCMYYGTLIVMYVVPSGDQSFNVNKVLSLLYIIVTPLLNPIVYSFKNQELRNALNQCVHHISGKVHKM